MEGNRLKIAIIGAGNVATHLGKSLAKTACVSQIVARHADSALRLAKTIGEGCSATSDISELIADADFYLIAANDDSIAEIAAATPPYPGIWAHTSGSVSANVFEGKKQRFGVFYPLQTFSKNVELDLRSVPFFIEGNSETTMDALKAIASEISEKVEEADSSRRKVLHMAAVFACNFANLMWIEADEILHEGGLDMSYLMPLLQETLGKLNHVSAHEAQTGPARRGDTAVIADHMTHLPEDKRRIYGMLSKAILKKYGYPTKSLLNE